LGIIAEVLGTLTDMREIRFRAWDTFNNCFFKPLFEAYAGKLEELHLSLDGRLGIRDLLGYHDESTFDGRYVLNEYTGLKDKNGKEIYEGDIVRRPADGHEPRELYEVAWNQTQLFGFALQQGVYYYGIIEPDDRFEIIGNIYENPELIGK
jgi:hypothetical protein